MQIANVGIRERISHPGDFVSTAIIILIDWTISQTLPRVITRIRRTN